MWSKSLSLTSLLRISFPGRPISIQFVPEDDDGGESDDAVEPVQVAVVEHLVELPGHQAHLVRQKLLQARNLRQQPIALVDLGTSQTK